MQVCLETCQEHKISLIGPLLNVSKKTKLIFAF